MYFYQIYGNRISSDLEFPQLISIENLEEREADIVIRSGKIPEEIKEREPEQKIEFGETLSWLINKTTWFMVKDGKTIIYELRPGGNETYLRTYLLGYGLSMLFLQRGELTIHCSAVAKSGKAVLISGESGSGTSTLTSHFLKDGYTLMADDVALVNMCDGKATVYPAFPYQKLCRDAALKNGYRLEELIYIDEDKDKFLVPYQGNFSTEGCDAQAMLWLVTEEKISEPYKMELTGMNKFYCCANNLFLRKLLREKRYNTMVGPKCLEIASAVPMYMLRRPVSGNTEEQIWQLAKTCVE